ncbi:hypothetical protein RclHR1_13780004 [Rhizophagus clarus]|uniref:Uncharacterized protein n=1 Tax=Rhizophagus clarus TaxID=94130 RepID=A0A2Z6QFG0_9GLOM|nr:hypothetical protein RclHR1_13780004 [Rhizophagus clarus]
MDEFMENNRDELENQVSQNNNGNQMNFEHTFNDNDQKAKLNRRRNKDDITSHKNKKRRNLKDTNRLKNRNQFKFKDYSLDNAKINDNDKKNMIADIGIAQNAINDEVNSFLVTQANENSKNYSNLDPNDAIIISTYNIYRDFVNSNNVKILNEHEKNNIINVRDDLFKSLNNEQKENFNNKYEKKLTNARQTISLNCLKEDDIKLLLIQETINEYQKNISSGDDLANLFSNLIIEDYKEYNYQIEYNIILVDDILFGINTNSNDEEAFLYKPILQLPSFNNLQIPQKGDPLWWNDSCAEFANSMVHLRNSSYTKLTINIEAIIKQTDLIEIEIIKLIINIIKNEFNGLELNLIQIMLTLDYLKYNDKKYRINIDFYKKNLNKSLLTILNGARNILILFGPYGYDSLYENLEFIELDIRAILGFNQEALKYFALNNLIEMKLHKKHLHISNSNDYVKVICEGAKLID